MSDKEKNRGLFYLFMIFYIITGIILLFIGLANKFQFGWIAKVNSQSTILSMVSFLSGTHLSILGIILVMIGIFGGVIDSIVGTMLSER